MHKLLLRNAGILMLLLLISLQSAFAQSLEQKKKIIDSYDQGRLKMLERDYNTRNIERKSRALELAQVNGWEVFVANPDGTVDELMDVTPDGRPLYYTIYNVDAARSTRANHLNIGGSLGLSLDGQNMTAHVWDGGPTRPTHQEFDGPGGNNRVTINDGVTTLNGNSFHAQHVTGTIVASGVVAQAKGMAPQAAAFTHEWNNDLAEATAEAASGMLISNHSYGYNAQFLPDWYFGAYIAESRDWDNLMYNSPFYLMVVAAGNDGNNNSANAAPLAGNSSFDKLSGHSTSKNNMVVANGQDANVNPDGTLNSVLINSSSSEGPTDDYRIKPDITGNGTGVYSTYDNSDAAYNSISGTSMASPNVAGSLLLLQQHFNNLNGTFMRAATLKGLALHTADDAGIAGPDAIYGWGLLNTKAAAEAISNNGVTSRVEELTLLPGQTYTITVDADGVNPLIASISWTDPAGVANTGTTNNTTPVLVNDLDIRVIQGGNTFFPFRLTGVNSNGLGDNDVDPFERVNVNNASGSYTIQVTHEGTLTNGSQNFSLVVTGITSAPVACTATTPSGLAASNVGISTATLSWNAVAGTSYDVRYRVSGTTGWTTVSSATTSVDLTSLAGDTQYEAQVRSRCPDNTTSVYSASVFFTTSSSNCAGGISSFPYTESFENTLGLWTQSTADDINWTINSGGTPSSNTGPSGAANGTYYIYMEVSGQGTGFPTKRAILNSPCIDLGAESAAGISFNYHMLGNSTGTLSLEVSNDNGNSWFTAWSRTGNQGSAWNLAEVDLSAYAGGSILLRFNGISGSSWDGDIAVDNVEITGGSGVDTQAPTAPANLAASNITETTLTLTWNASTDNVGVTGYDVYEGSANLGTVTGTSANITGLTAGSSYSFRVKAKDAVGNESAFSNTVNVTTPSASISCGTTVTAPYAESFESGFGSWTNITGDDFDWVRRSGGTPSSNTGPSGAAAGSFYIYVEASSPNYPSKSTTLESPCFDLTGVTSATFSFRYHMLGASSMGALNIEISTDDNTWTNIWSRSGNQGSSWQTASIDLSGYTGNVVKLRMTGTTTNTWQGDIAVDDMSLTAGNLNNLTLTIVLDNYPGETSWRIDDGSTILASGSGYSGAGSTVVENITLPDGCYNFVIFDSYGDGICCAFGSGSYSLNNGTTVLASGGAFGSSETTNFCLDGTTVASYAVNTIAEGSPVNVNIYPNPVRDGVVYVDMNRDDVYYSLTDLSGKKVLSGQLKQNRVEVGEMNPGVYLLEITDGYKSLMQKIVIE